MFGVDDCLKLSLHTKNENQAHAKNKRVAGDETVLNVLLFHSRASFIHQTDAKRRKKKLKTENQAGNI